MKKPFDENADENLSAVVHFQCIIFMRLTYKIIKSCGTFCRIDDAIVSNLTLTIRPTALCDNSEHLRYTVVHRHKLKWKMSAPHIILDNLPSLCQKLSDLVEV